jgi:exodeoxyribonuclease V beta subunit
MSIALDPLRFPLHGSRLIEASAGTGKTWTIAALYVRLVLGHGGDAAFARALLPPEILVMTFTRAATRELTQRVRQRLVEAAAFFRAEDGDDARDPFLAALAEDCEGVLTRQQAAHRLALAAETMDEAAIFTIDAWCQRMLREHAFDSGSLFDEELVADERGLFEDAAHDYWRQQVYPLKADGLRVLLGCFGDVGSMKLALRDLVHKPTISQATGHADSSLGAVIAQAQGEHAQALAALKQGWGERIDAMECWIAGQRDANPKCFNGVKLRAENVAKWFEALRAWVADPWLDEPRLTDAAWKRLTPDGMADACSKGFAPSIPACFDATAGLQADLARLQPVAHAIIRHACASVARRMALLKSQANQFGFADMLERLKTALAGANGEALRARITAQFPVAMVDEFQDTSPDQYAIFDLLYRVADNDAAHGLFLIGDPKQSIYGFRGADIHSYLAARRATEGRHYKLGTNYRSTKALVAAVNRLFLHAEGDASAGHAGFAAGAFRFRDGDDNPLPFEAVDAAGHDEVLEGVSAPYQALTLALPAADGDSLEALKAEQYRTFFANHCAEHIVGLLNDAKVGFATPGKALRRLAPADIAILVRDRREAQAVRRALMARRVRSVYLSDRDSVIDSLEAADVLRWLAAVANPLDPALARAAFATTTAGLPLSALAWMAADELAWEGRIEQLKNLHTVWQRQGVLAMLRRLIHELGLPARLLAEAGGERRLTNLLHLAELLQAASRGLDGEQALIRWYREQLAGLGEAGDERVLRLESDAELVKVVTVHKSKGLEYPLVYLPFAVSARPTDKKGRRFFEYTDGAGERQIDLGLSDAALEAVERARIAEDLRLLYVAVTRARHFLWLGVAAVATRKKDENHLHDSAFGYLLAGGEKIAAGMLEDHLQQLAEASAEGVIDILPLPASDSVTALARTEARPQLRDAVPFAARFERNWSVGSFTSLSRQLAPATVAAPMRALEETLLEEADEAPQGDDAGRNARTSDAPWHRFPRGAVPGNFLHEQLEWMAGEGFDCIDQPNFDERLALRCQRAGWGNRQLDAIAWLRMVAATPLPPLGVPLAALRGVLPEMEFWFPSEQLDAGALDRLCAARLLPGVARPALPQRQLHGMLKGFADLVFEHEGRYWVLDYKSNALGGVDGAYSDKAMAAGMAEHRYDVQGAIYMLALHRLLKARLGASYTPARQLGGAVFLFLRGIANPATHGCCLLAPDVALLDGLDALLAGDAAIEDVSGEPS